MINRNRWGQSGLALTLLSLLAGALQARAVMLNPPATPSAPPAQTFRDAYRSSSGYPAQAVVEVDVPLRIRMGIMSAQSKVRLKTQGPTQFSCNGETFEAGPGETWSVVLVTGQSGKTEEMPLVARVPWDRPDELQRLQGVWSSRGLPVTARPMGVLLTERQTGRVINDSRCWFLTLPVEKGWTEAWNRCIDISGPDCNPTVYERLISLPEGTMALVDPRGKVRARGPRVTMVTPGKLRVLRVEHDKDLPQHGFEDRSYDRRADVDIDAMGKLAVSTPIALEDYLKGVVPSEIYASDPGEALKAQAVAARSETLFGLGFSSAADPYDICSDQHCQAYRGVDQRDPRTDAAVDATRGLVLKHGRTILNAVYSDTCGGHSESLEKIWSLPPNPAMRGRPDLPPETLAKMDLMNSEQDLAKFLAGAPPAYCARGKNGSSKVFRWKVTKDVDQLTTLVNKRYKIGRLQGLVPLDRGHSGRMRRLLAIGSKGEAVIYKELSIRQALGGLNSGMFSIHPEKTSKGAVHAFTFRGGGWGHGVGLCQSGSRARAEDGHTFQQILGHYYGGSVLESVE